MKREEIIQLSVDNTYRKFINIVAEGRGLEAEAVEKIAGGRIWSGLDAVENGLIDKTGYFDDALNEASKLAGLDNYNVIYMDPEEDWKTQAVKELTLIINKIKSSPFEKFSAQQQILHHFLSAGIMMIISLNPGAFYSWSSAADSFLIMMHIT